MDIHTAHTHTPAPWRLGRRIANPAIYGPNGLEIAEIFRDMNPDWVGNAKLVTAAPDLLAACRLALGVFRTQFPLEHGNPEICAAWGAIESAMEKAGA